MVVVLGKNGGGFREKWVKKNGGGFREKWWWF